MYEMIMRRSQCSVKKRERKEKRRGEGHVKHEGEGGGTLKRDIINGGKKRGGGREMYRWWLKKKGRMGYLSLKFDMRYKRIYYFL